MRIPLLLLPGYPLPLLITSLTLLLLHQVLIGNIEHGRDVLDCGSDWIEGSALGFDGCFEELDLIGFEEF